MDHGRIELALREREAQELLDSAGEALPSREGSSSREVFAAACTQYEGVKRARYGDAVARYKQALKEARKKSRHKKQTDTHRSFSHGRKPRSILTLEPDQYHRLNSTEKKSLQALRDKASGKTKE